ncbi:MAG: MFS transporter [Gammaproteobacteria bacterium]|nr:MFS transporter [Gammaproteobacteria bacterium]
MSEQEITLDAPATAASASFTLLLIALSLIVFLINVDYTAVNLALPTMANDLQASLGTIQWVLTAYVLTWALLIFPCGSLLAKFTTRQLCLGGLSLFTLASLLAGMAFTSHLLIFARMLQGLSAAIYAPAVYGLIHCYVPEDKRGRAMGLLSLGVGLGLAIGPFVGGTLVALGSWRAIFLVNLPIGLLAFYVIYKQRDIQQQKNTAVPFSKISALLIGFTTLSLIYLLNQWQVWQQNASLYLVWIVFAIASFVGFIYVQKKILHPLIPLDLFRNRTFSACCLGIFLEQAGFSITIMATSLYLQNILHYSPLASGFIFLFLTVIFGIIAMIGGRWVDQKGLTLPTITGMIIMAVGALLFAVVASGQQGLLVCPVLFITGIGMGLAFIGLNTGIVKAVTQEQVGIATSIFMVLALISNSFGITLTTLFYQHAQRIGGLNGISEIMLLSMGISLIAAISFWQLNRAKSMNQ